MTAPSNSSASSYTGIWEAGLDRQEFGDHPGADPGMEGVVGGWSVAIFNRVRDVNPLLVTNKELVTARESFMFASYFCYIRRLFIINFKMRIFCHTSLDGYPCVVSF